VSDETPRLAVVSYPSLSEADRQWLQSVRARHDPQALLLPAHFTLVFPVAVTPGAVMAELCAALERAKPVSFVIRRVLAVPSAVGGGGHVFLVPDEGAAAITILHEQLYRGALQAHLRRDLTFRPHITVAANAEFQCCRTLAEDLGRSAPVLHGVLESVEVITIASGAVSTFARIALNGP
jgi:2'-5' RNA ligase